MKKNNNNICRMTLLALPLLMLSACSQDDTFSTEQTITLTTPVIELSSVQASSRAASMESLASNALITLYLHDSEAREFNRFGSYSGTDNDNGWLWTPGSSVTVTGGEGHYRAGILADINLNAIGEKTDPDYMPAINYAVYAYRGSINVTSNGTSNGTFTPDEALQPYTAAILLNLKDADGNDIDPDGTDATSGKVNKNVFRINPVGLAFMNGFLDMDADGNVTDGSYGQFFPNGTTANPEPVAIDWNSIELSIKADARFIPGTYPTTWENRKLNRNPSEPTAPWPLFEVTYCKYGFNSGTPNGTATTWTVNYPAQQLTLEAGKLYTFTATLGADAHITLDAKDAVTIAPWTEGSTINVGR